MEPSTSSSVADEAKRHLHSDFSRVVIWQIDGSGETVLLYSNCKVLPREPQKLADSFGDRDAAISQGLWLEGRRYEVHRHHPPLVYGRSMADCEPELSTGVAVCRVERGRGGIPTYIAATYEQPRTSAQAVPRLVDFAERYLAEAAS